jgi:hypothetical protein
MPVLRPIRRPRLPRARLGTRLIRPAAAPPGTLPDLVAHNESNSGTTGNTPTSAAVVMPTWTVGSSDLIVVMLTVEFSSQVFTEPSTGPAWTAGDTVFSADNPVTCHTAWRQAQAGDSGATYTWPFSGGGASKWSAEVRVYSNSAAVDQHAMQANTAAAGPSYPQVTPTSGQTDPIVVMGGARATANGATTPDFTPPSGYANDFDSQTSAASAINVTAHGSDLLAGVVGGSAYTPPAGTLNVVTGSVTATLALTPATTGAAAGPPPVLVSQYTGRW